MTTLAPRRSYVTPVAAPSSVSCCQEEEKKVLKHQRNSNASESTMPPTCCSHKLPSSNYITESKDLKVTPRWWWWWGIRFFYDGMHSYKVMPHFYITIGDTMTSLLVMQHPEPSRWQQGGVGGGGWGGTKYHGP